METDMKKGARGIRVVAIALATVLALGGCAAKISVSQDYDPNVDFSAIRSFNWLGIQNASGLSAFDIGRVEKAFRNELKSKGLRELTNADILVAAYLGMRPKLGTKWEYSHGLYWEEQPIKIPQGLLILDIVDAKSRKLIWRARATGIGEPNASPEQRERSIARVAKRVLSKLPPTGR
jgi:hypothetical protein